MVTHHARMQQSGGEVATHVTHMCDDTAARHYHTETQLRMSSLPDLRVLDPTEEMILAPSSLAREESDAGGVGS